MSEHPGKVLWKTNSHVSTWRTDLNSFYPNGGWEIACMSHAKFQRQQVLLYLRRTIWSKRSSQEGRAQIHRNHPSSFIFKSDLNDLLFFHIWVSGSVTKSLLLLMKGQIFFSKTRLKTHKCWSVLISCLWGRRKTRRNVYLKMQALSKIHNSLIKVEDLKSNNRWLVIRI